MATTVRDIMTKDPVTLETTATARDAARRMRDDEIGDVLVVDGPTLRGIVTDRDLATRVMADDRDAGTVTLGDVATTGVDAVSPNDDARKVVDRMRRTAVKRVPVVEDNTPIGILSMGDLAMEFEEGSALAQVSAASSDRQG